MNETAVPSVMTPEVRASIEAAVGKDNVISDREMMVDYGRDESSREDLACHPGLVVKPGNEVEVAEVLKIANINMIPVTPRGGATGLCGGCVPSEGGLVLSMERMNKVLEIDTANQLGTAEAGVRLQEFSMAVEYAGLYFPPHPGDESAMMGGLVATNAGGCRAVKYGTVRSYVRGLEVVLPTGEIVKLGGKFVKSSTGYNLMQLMIGSEGTLGVVTKVTLQLHAKPPLSRSFVVPYAGLEEAMKTMEALMSKGIVPLAIEFLDVEPIALAEEKLGLRWPSRLGKVHLLIMIDAYSNDELDGISQAIADLCIDSGAINVFIADTAAKQAEVLALRSRLYDVLKPGMVEGLDVSLPRAEVAGHVARVGELAAQYGLWLPTFGHAADGNVHTHIMKDRLEDGKMVKVPGSEWEAAAEAVREAIFADCRARGGVISGEHGIGLVKKPSLHHSLSTVHVDLMRGIKRVFDPNGIMNPGKIFD